MALTTGIPEGDLIAQEEVFIEGAPYIYYQDYRADPVGPDTDGYYWGLTGTTEYPIYELACYEDVSLADDLTVNAVRCDQVGDRAVIQKRNHLVFSFSLSTLFPLTTISPVMRASIPDASPATDFEKMGIGTINNNAYYRVYLPKVYDEADFDWVSITIHRAQFVDAWTIGMVSGDKWMLGGIALWALSDSTMPSGQEFATVIRWDRTVL